MTINKIKDNNFEILNETTIMNSFTKDLPDWMNTLIILQCVKSKKLLDFGFKNIELRIKNDHWFEGLSDEN